MCGPVRCFEVPKLCKDPLSCLRSSGGQGAFPVPSRGRADLPQTLHSAAKKDHGLVYRLSGEVLHIYWDRSSTVSSRIWACPFSVPPVQPSPVHPGSSLQDSLEPHRLQFKFHLFLPHLLVMSRVAKGKCSTTVKWG